MDTSSKKVARMLFILVLVWAAVLRTWRLDAPLFWVDEAESTINALTILQHGVPVDHYLGLPLYENTLTQPWPEHPEYEFKDSSYSGKGLAVYHGWLPLYMMAGSLAAFGIHPDEAPVPGEALKVRHTDVEMRRMTSAARLPAVAFGMLLLALLFFTAREMYGEDAGWAALIIGAFSQRVTNIAREARYYSATVTFSLACCLMVWRIFRRGSWADYLMATVAFVLLFYTHTVTFLVACGAFATVVPFIFRRAGEVRKLAAFGAIVLACTAPWAILSGFLNQATGIPKAWPHLKFPDDLFTFPMSRPHVFALLVVGAVAVGLAELARRKLPARLAAPFVERRAAFHFLIAWVVLGYLSFVFLMPAVSYIFSRMALPMLAPGVVLAAMIFAAAGRAIVGRASPMIATALVVCFMTAFSRPRLLPYEPFKSLSTNTSYVIGWLRGYKIEPDTKLYSLPNKHLIFSVYTGMPVQSVAPVRKSFIDSYPGGILLIEDVIHYQPPPLDSVRQACSDFSMSQDEAGETSRWVMCRAIRQRLQGKVAHIDPPLEGEAVPHHLQKLVDDEPAFTIDWLHNSEFNPIYECPAVFRAYPIDDWSEWWQVYFYRFVDPKSRMGEKANYAERMKTSNAYVLPSGWTIYEMPPKPRGGGAAAADTPR